MIGSHPKLRQLTPAKRAVLILLVLVLVRWLTSANYPGREQINGTDPTATSVVTGSAAPDRLVTVLRVSDGDTFVTVEDSRRVRLIGIDAPELLRDDHPEDFYARESAQWLTVRIQGQQVRLRFGPELEDRYGRLLAWVYLQDGTLLNRQILATGNARLLTRFGLPPDLEPELRAAEADARVRGLGLWQKRP